MGILCRCDVCGKTSSKLDNFYNFKLRNYATNEFLPRDFVICGDCVTETFTPESSKGEEDVSEGARPVQRHKPGPRQLDLDKEDNQSPMTNEADNVFTPYIGMNLREFLSTPWYVNSFDNYIFVNSEGEEIMDVSEYMRRHIVYIARSSKEPNDVIVTMSESDYETPDEDDDILV